MARPNRPIPTGGCQCGAVRCVLTVPPKRVHLCRCGMCQKGVGGPLAALAPVQLGEFAWTRGTPASFAGSSLAHRDFCARCGRPWSFRYDNGETIAVTLGSLDRPQDVPPVRHYGFEARIGWLDGIDSLPAETTEDSLSAERASKYVSCRHPDHETAPDWRPLR